MHSSDFWWPLWYTVIHSFSLLKYIPISDDAIAHNVLYSGLAGSYIAHIASNRNDNTNMWPRQALATLNLFMFAILLAWLIVAIDTCTHGEANVRCANDNKYTANDILGLSDWDVYTTCEKQDSLNQQITMGYCPTLGLTLGIGFITSALALMGSFYAKHENNGGAYRELNSNVAYKIGHLMF